MKRFWQKVTHPKVLFYTTIGFIFAALVSGFIINFLVHGENRIPNAIAMGIPLILLVIYLLVGYIYRITNTLRNIYQTQGNLWQFYWRDELFRTSVGDSIGCFIILCNAFINFTFSFFGFQSYFLSIAAIFFLLFTMKLYLIINLGHGEKRQQHVIMWLMLFMSLASAAVAVMLWFNKTGYIYKGFLIYWDALYAFIALTLAIIGVVKAIKNKDAVLGRFLAIQLANAIFGMFTLTISMIMAFGDNFNEMKPLALMVGIVATMLINAVAVTQFVLAQRLAKQN